MIDCKPSLIVDRISGTHCICYGKEQQYENIVENIVLRILCFAQLTVDVDDVGQLASAIPTKLTSCPSTWCGFSRSFCTLSKSKLEKYNVCWARYIHYIDFQSPIWKETNIRTWISSEVDACASPIIFVSPFCSHWPYTSWNVCISRLRNGSDDEINCSSRNRLIKKCGLDSFAAINAELNHDEMMRVKWLKTRDTNQTHYNMKFHLHFVIHIFFEIFKQFRRCLGQWWMFYICQIQIVHKLIGQMIETIHCGLW